MQIFKSLPQYVLAASAAFSTAQALVPGTYRHFKLDDRGIWSGEGWRDYDCDGYFLVLSEVLLWAKDTYWHNTPWGPRWTAVEHIDWDGAKRIKYFLQAEHGKVSLDRVYLLPGAEDANPPAKGVECSPR